jgi:hypothetical protein
MSLTSSPLRSVFTLTLLTTVIGTWSALAQDSDFGGKIDHDVRKSTPQWPTVVKPKSGACCFSNSVANSCANYLAHQPRTGRTISGLADDQILASRLHDIE